MFNQIANVYGTPNMMLEDRNRTIPTHAAPYDVRMDGNGASMYCCTLQCRDHPSCARDQDAPGTWS